LTKSRPFVEKLVELALCVEGLLRVGDADHGII
jgi:hypothetical protein